MKVTRSCSWIEHVRNRKIVRIWYMRVMLGARASTVPVRMVGWCRMRSDIFLAFAALKWQRCITIRALFFRLPWGLADHSLECRSEMVSSNCLEAACAALQVGDAEFLHTLAVVMPCAHVCLLYSIYVKLRTLKPFGRYNQCAVFLSWKKRCSISLVVRAMLTGKQRHLPCLHESGSLWKESLWKLQWGVEQEMYMICTMYLDDYLFLGNVGNMEEANGFAVPVQNVQEHPVGVTDLQAQASQAQCHQCFCTLKHPVRNCTRFPALSH